MQKSWLCHYNIDYSHRRRQGEHMERPPSEMENIVVEKLSYFRRLYFEQQLFKKLLKFHFSIEFLSQIFKIFSKFPNNWNFSSKHGLNNSFFAIFVWNYFESVRKFSCVRGEPKSWRCRWFLTSKDISSPTRPTPNSFQQFSKHHQGKNRCREWCYFLRVVILLPSPILVLPKEQFLEKFLACINVFIASLKS